jgi:hypothetical protein
MAQFGDVYKNVSDFFKKSFNYDNKVELKAVADNGVVFTAEGGVSEKKRGLATLKAEYKKGSTHLNKLELDASGKLAGELAFPQVAAGTKAVFKFEDGSRASAAKTSATFGLETKQDLGVLAGIKVDAEVVSGLLDASVLFNQNGVLVGASTSVNTHLNDKSAAGAEVTAYDALLAYKTPLSLYGLQTGKKFSEATAFFQSLVNPRAQVSAQATFGLAAAAKPVNVKFGGKYAVDQASVLAAAIDQNANLQVGYTAQLSPAASLSVYGELKTLDMAGDAHRTGLKLSLKA